MQQLSKQKRYGEDYFKTMSTFSYLVSEINNNQQEWVCNNAVRLYLGTAVSLLLELASAGSQISIAISRAIELLS